MSDISVKLCGMKLNNPVMPAAGPPVRDGACIKLCAEGGAGCLVTKTISNVAANVPRPCMQEINGGFLNTELWSELPPEQWFDHEYKEVRKIGMPVIVSLGYNSEQLDEIVPRAVKYADAFEISTHYVGKDIKPIVDALHAAKKGGVPVFMKISPGIPDVAGYAKILENEGADGFIAINSVGPCLKIDINTGLPFMGSEKGYGWLSGKAIKPIALRHVYEIASVVSVPVIGVGGISTGEDVIEMIMAGASAVQICTEAILSGPSIYGRIAKQVDSWMDEHGYNNLDEIRGLTIKKMKQRNWGTEPHYPKVDENKCIACGKCLRSCAYQAIEIDEKAHINPEKCFGCGLCVTRCPRNAIEIIY